MFEGFNVKIFKNTFTKIVKSRTRGHSIQTCFYQLKTLLINQKKNAVNSLLK